MCVCVCVCVYLLHFKYQPFPGLIPGNPYSIWHLLCFYEPVPSPTYSTSLPWHLPTLGHGAFTGLRTSPPTDVWLYHPLLYMQLESWVPLFVWWLSPWVLWSVCSVHIVVLPIRLQTPSAPSVLPLTAPLGTHDQSDCWLWASASVLANPGRASQETVILCSYQQALVGIHNSDCAWFLYMGWIQRLDRIWMVIP